MAIAWVRSATPVNGTTPQATANAAVTAGDTLIGFAVTYFQTISSMSDGTNGAYTPPTPLSLDSGFGADTESVGCGCVLSAGSGTYGTSCVASGGSLTLWQYEYSGVTSIDNGVWSNPQNPGTTVSGAAVTVSTGAVLIALCSHTGSAIPSATNGGTTRDSGTVAGSIHYAVGEWTGSGSSITPQFSSSDGATNNFDVIQFILHPSGGGSAPLMGQACL
jgi:hypothetical protein